MNNLEITEDLIEYELGLANNEFLNNFDVIESGEDYLLVTGTYDVLIEDEYTNDFEWITEEFIISINI